MEDTHVIFKEVVGYNLGSLLDNIAMGVNWQAGNPAAFCPQERECTRCDRGYRWTISCYDRTPKRMARKSIGVDSPRSLPDILTNSKAATGCEEPTIRYWNAVPENWEMVKYEDFLKRRRGSIAQAIRDGFEKI